NSDHHRSRMKGIATVPEYATWPGGRVTGSGLRWRPLGVLLIAFLGGRREHRPGGQDDDYDEPDREEPPEPPARAAGRHGARVIRPGQRGEHGRRHADARSVGRTARPVRADSRTASTRAKLCTLSRRWVSGRRPWRTASTSWARPWPSSPSGMGSGARVRG